MPNLFKGIDRQNLLFQDQNQFRFFGATVCNKGQKEAKRQKTKQI
jgi:hypothetical protein